MHWTAAADQIVRAQFVSLQDILIPANVLAIEQLLIKLLETHPMVIDNAAIAAAWPVGFPYGEEEAPTAKAIQDRISKIRVATRKPGGFDFSKLVAPARSSKDEVTKIVAHPRTRKQTLSAADHKVKVEDTGDDFLFRPHKTMTTDQLRMKLEDTGDNILSQLPEEVSVEAKDISRSMKSLGNDQTDDEGGL
ncbi:hypothetical protein N7539_002156 [Penicillium diatomitis]|uniref:Uncharacterized protein n=1 Tax=Penicillium diatomitis TaxID=2819901 RepID=A0A9W9XIU9_9EURO|nr:uncharacterized protein N7539_002156 [Penicillium diatomitis]KAJ5493410.1 hypothetical protein N7539_002156 [Penicillium diatomitis]